MKPITINMIAAIVSIILIAIAIKSFSQENQNFTLAGKIWQEQRTPGKGKYYDIFKFNEDGSCEVYFIILNNDGGSVITIKKNEKLKNYYELDGHLYITSSDNKNSDYIIKWVNENEFKLYSSIYSNEGSSYVTQRSKSDEISKNLVLPYLLTQVKNRDNVPNIFADLYKAETGKSLFLQKSVTFKSVEADPDTGYETLDIDQNGSFLRKTETPDKFGNSLYKGNYKEKGDTIIFSQMDIRGDNRQVIKYLISISEEELELTTVGKNPTKKKYSKSF